jgi:tetratricopeptide (TPR) repeat protein
MASVAGPARRFLLLSLMLSACGSALSEHPPESVTRYLPATLETAHARVGDARIAKVRIYVDPGVRALPHWKEDIADQLDYASQLLQPLVGVKLAVESYKDWPRSRGVNDALRELAEDDKATDVAWVIGYVTPSDVASTAMSELGDAQPLGHHVMVRAWAEKPEIDALAGKLPDMKDGERTEVIAAHRRHKQTVVLLHMLATTLGAIAEVDPTWIQHVSYAPKQNMFSNRNRDLLQLAVDSRLAGDSDEAVAKKLADSIERAEWGGWIPSSHDQVLAALHNLVEAGRSGKTFADVPPAAFDAFKRVTELAKQGKPADALAELDNLLIAYPANATMHELKCEIMLGTPGVADKTTRATCARVSELAPGDPTVHVAVGQALIRAGEVEEARKELTVAEDKIANLPVGTADAWRKLIAIYTGLGSLTWTEDAIARAKLEHDPAAIALAQTRARYGIPRGAAFVTPAQEAALVAAIRLALDLVYASKFAEAERALAAGEKKWPNAPGLVAARCDLALRMSQFDAARGACARALAADPEDSWAIYLQGVLYLRDAGTTPAGIARLKKAIEIDPELGQAWRTLGKAYERGHNKAALEELDQAYRVKFGTPLPRG